MVGVLKMKVLIGVTSCHKYDYTIPKDCEWDRLHRIEVGMAMRHHNLMQAARDTWCKETASNGVDYKFFYGRGAQRDPLPDEVFMPCDDSYAGLPEKVVNMCIYAQHYGYDFMMKADIDSYINVPRFMDCGFEMYDYMGCTWGLGYILSAKSMRVIAAEPRKLAIGEDSHVLKCILAAPGMRIYFDGRFLYIPAFYKNLGYDLQMHYEFPLAVVDKTFVVVNPNSPETMRALHETKSLVHVYNNVGFPKPIRGSENGLQ